MAIQHRRGAFSNFDPTRMLPGEWAIVLSGDTSTSDGKAAYICFAAGTVKRIATYDDMYTDISAIEADITADLVSITAAAAQEAHDAATDAGNYGLRIGQLEEEVFRHAYQQEDIDELKSCCSSVNADLAAMALTLAALAATWQYASEGLFAPSAAAFSVAGTTATIAATVSGTTLVLS